MKQSNKGFDYSYNAQAVVDADEQIIVAAEVTNQANDKQQGVPMAQAALDNVNAPRSTGPVGGRTPVPIPNTADSGYFSEQAVADLEKMGIDPHIARSTETPRENGSAGGGRTRARSKCQGKDATQTTHGTASCSMQRASTSSSQYSARSSRRVASASFCCAAWRRYRRVATDLFDAQLTEDLASRPCCHGKLKDRCAPRVGLEAEKAKAK